MLMDSWLSLISASNSEIQAACLHSVGHVVAHVFSTSTNSSATDGVSAATGETSRSACEPHSSGPAGADVVDDVVEDIKRFLLNELSRHRHAKSIVQVLLKYAHQPILSTRCASICVLAALASNSTRFGMHALISDSAFRTYVATPGTETAKECMEAKYVLLKKIEHNPQFGLLGAEITEEIIKLVKRGPFYSPPRMEEPVVLDR